MKVALVHDFLMQMGGAEKVVEVFHDMFPDAPLYTSAYDPNAMPERYRQWDIHTSFLQRLPAKHKLHRAALLLYPTAFESFDLSQFDLVLSSSSSFAKGVITQPHTTHVCYTHTPMRFAWTPRSYMKEERVSMMARTLLGPGLHYLRTWDALAAMRVDNYIANSRTVADRIQKFYRRDATVIHPPVDTSRFQIANEIGDYYIMVTRFAPYKRLDLAVKAMTKLGRPLKIVGGGRYGAELKKIAGPTVEFMGHVSDAELPKLLASAKAYIMPGMEDFGIAPVEANACGRPVIAYGAGGALDSQIDGVTGVLFREAKVQSLIDAVKRADEIAFDSHAIREHALSFDTARFKERMTHFLSSVMPERIALDSENGFSQRRRSGVYRMMEPLSSDYKDFGSPLESIHQSN
ncbi:glycosyltransferase family 4 protein [bacterium]|nr:MAG: glycosyltransferase family 4 protein [bacterium]